jgi:branched-chain amino acid transport system permease protein
MGSVSMGHAAFYAVGAYVSALLAKDFGMNFFVSALIGAALAGICGYLLGLPTLRLTGSYLAIATMGFSEVVKVVTLNWDDVTNGPLGLKLIPTPKLFGLELTTENGGLYYLLLVLLALVILLCIAIKNSKMGRALFAIKNDELAAKLMGVETNRYKVSAFVIAAVIAGYMGAFYASMTSFIDPNTFTIDTSTQILCIVLLGGLGSISGMILGSALLMSFPEFLRFADSYRFVIYGVLMILMMLFRPQGILGGLSRKPYKLPKGITVNKLGGENDGNA